MSTGFLVIQGIAAIAGLLEQRKVTKAQKKQNKIKNKIAAVARRRSVRQSIAAKRIRTADILAAGFQLGVSGGTAVSGATAGLASDTASGIGASNLQFSGQQAIADLSDNISGFQQNIGTFGAIGAAAAPFAGSAGAQNRAAVTDFFGFGG